MTYIVEYIIPGSAKSDKFVIYGEAKLSNFILNCAHCGCIIKSIVNTSDSVEA